MNKARRKALQEIADEITTAREKLDMLKDEEEEYLENIPENLQTSARYEQSEEAVSELEAALDSLDEAITSIETAAGE